MSNSETPGEIGYVLRDGLHFRLRPVRAEDRRRLLEGFSKLSEKTRHQRFFRSMTSLNEQDLDYLTQVDQRDHVAWAAVDWTAEERGMGLGRLIRLAEEPTVGEFALVVIDEYQRRGLGTVLLGLLLLLAEPLGLRALRGVVLSDNEAMLRMMVSLGAVEVGDDPWVAVFELPVGESVPAFPGTLAAIRFEETKCDLRAHLAASKRAVRGEQGGPA